MARNKDVILGATVTLRMRADQVEALKSLARSQAFKENREVTFTDLVRDAVRDKFGGLFAAERK